MSLYVTLTGLSATKRSSIYPFLHPSSPLSLPISFPFCISMSLSLALISLYRRGLFLSYKKCSQSTNEFSDSLSPSASVSLSQMNMHTRIQTNIHMQVLTAAHQGCNVIVWFAINIQLNQSSGTPMVSIITAPSGRTHF